MRYGSRQYQSTPTAAYSLDPILNLDGQHLIRGREYPLTIRQRELASTTTSQCKTYYATQAEIELMLSKR